MSVQMIGQPKERSLLVMLHLFSFIEIFCPETWKDDSLGDEGLFMLKTLASSSSATAVQYASIHVSGIDATAVLPHIQRPATGQKFKVINFKFVKA